MTRKDYTLIADIIVEQHLLRVLPGETPVPESILIGPATRILESSSASFDPQKFRDYIIKKLNRA